MFVTKMHYVTSLSDLSSSLLRVYSKAFLTCDTMSSVHYKIIFFGCHDAFRFSEKLQRCQFAHRCPAKQVFIVGRDVHFSFTTAQPMTKNAVQKVCT